MREWYFLPSLSVLITLFLTSLDTIRQLAGQRHTESSWQTQMHYAHYAQHHTGGGWVICPSLMHICWYKTNDSYWNLALTLKLHISWWFILAGPNGAASKIKRTLTPAKKSMVSKFLHNHVIFFRNFENLKTKVGGILKKIRMTIPYTYRAINEGNTNGRIFKDVLDGVYAICMHCMAGVVWKY